MDRTKTMWWRGARGEWYVVAQLVLIAVVFLCPRTLPGLPPWPAALELVTLYAGVALIAAGFCLLFVSLFRLGRNLTPLPYPKTQASFVRTGPYRFVRHPMYGGGIILAFGWALAVHGWLTLTYAAALLVFFEIKVAREERWLVEKFPGYRDYQKQVRKLIPFIH